MAISERRLVGFVFEQASEQKSYTLEWPAIRYKTPRRIRNHPFILILQAHSNSKMKTAILFPLVFATLLHANVATAASYCNTYDAEAVPYNGLDYNVLIPYYKVKGKATYNCIMNTGATGEGVGILQYNINNCYPPKPKLKVDGEYGPKTKAAVKAMQKKAGTTADGVYGPKTQFKMKYEGVSSKGSKCLRYA
jgi:Putative peptidoglycan binding domain